MAIDSRINKIRKQKATKKLLQKKIAAANAAPEAAKAAPAKSK